MRCEGWAKNNVKINKLSFSPLGPQDYTQDLIQPYHKNEIQTQLFLTRTPNMSTQQVHQLDNEWKKVVEKWERDNEEWEKEFKECKRLLNEAKKSMGRLKLWEMVRRSEEERKNQ